MSSSSVYFVNDVDVVPRLEVILGVMAKVVDPELELVCQLECGSRVCASVLRRKSADNCSL